MAPQLLGYASGLSVVYVVHNFVVAYDQDISRYLNGGKGLVINLVRHRPWKPSTIIIQVYWVEFLDCNYCCSHGDPIAHELCIRSAIMCAMHNFVPTYDKHISCYLNRGRAWGSIWLWLNKSILQGWLQCRSRLFCEMKCVQVLRFKISRSQTMFLVVSWCCLAYLG